MNIPRKLLPALGACFLAMTTFLPAQDRVYKNNAATGNLIELYSSEGCSSCPPAEAWINRLQKAPGLWKDIFPVAFHVDYWDGLGWPDRFARPEYTQRQRDYAARLGQESVYTPEFVVNGREWHRSWLGGDALPSEAAAKMGELALTVHANGNFSASYRAMAGPTGALVLNVALLGLNVRTDVQRGENSGEKLEHDFVVLGFSSTPLQAQNDKSFQANPSPMKSSTGDAPGAVVAWVSDSNGAILQVTGGWLMTPGEEAAR
jgi:hypothetical protein